MAGQALETARAIERMRGALRDTSRLEVAARRARLQDAEQAAQTASNDITSALGVWADALKRRNPDPRLLGLMGAQVMRSEAAHKAAILDEKIAHQRWDDALQELAQSEAHLEGARMICGTAQREHDRRIEDFLTREVEDLFIHRRRS